MHFGVLCRVVCTFVEQHDIVEELESLGSRLQQGYKSGVLLRVSQVSQKLDDLECCGRVQARRDLILII